MPQTNLFFPLPLHITASSAFTPMDPTRFMSPYGGATMFDHFPPTAFGASSVPPMANLKCDKSISESIFSKIAGDTAPLQPPPSYSISSILNSSVAAKENEVSSSEETVSQPPTEKSETDMLLETAAKLLFLAVKWAKSVPSFLQLPTADQKVLLEESWAELFVITAAQWGLPIDNGEFVQWHYWFLLITYRKTGYL